MSSPIAPKLQMTRADRGRFEAALSAVANLVILLVDGEGGIQFVNRAFCGIDPADVVGRSVFDFLAPCEAEKLRRTLDDVKRSREVRCVECRARWEKEEGWFEIHVGSVVEQGKLTAAALVARDITSRRKVEDELRRAHNELEQRVEERATELRASNEELRREVAKHRQTQRSLQLVRAAVEHARDAILITGPEIDPAKARILYANRAFTRLSGYAAEDIIGEPTLILQSMANLWSEHGKIAQRLAEGKSCESLGVYRDKLGRELIVECKTDPVYGENGQITNWVSIQRDVTEHKQIEEILRETEKLGATAQMAGRIAHEINNPLAGIRNSFSLIEHAIPTDHPHYEFVGLIKREIDRIGNIVRTMYDLYRPERESVREFWLNDIVWDIVALLKSSCREKEVSIQSKLPAEPLRMCQSEGMLRQVLFNVVQNAIEASPRIGVVTLGARMEGDDLLLFISDEGPGVTPDMVSKIFLPGFTTKRGSLQSGLGLGLATSRALVEAMKGRIEYRERPGRSGACFEIWLPRLKPLEDGQPDGIED